MRSHRVIIGVALLAAAAVTLWYARSAFVNGITAELVESGNAITQLTQPPPGEDAEQTRQRREEAKAQEMIAKSDRETWEIVVYVLLGLSGALAISGIAVLSFSKRHDRPM